MSLTTLPPSCAVVSKSGNLNFLEPSGPLQVCNRTAFPLPLSIYQTKRGHITEDGNILFLKEIQGLMSPLRKPRNNSVTNCDQ